ncbi:unnamed protein product, partial [Urochloa humidicola]
GPNFPKAIDPLLPPFAAGGERRSLAMASRGRRILPGLEGTDPDRPPPPLTSDLHEEIFLRAASPADLARASAACVSFRRLISDPGFLRRAKSHSGQRLLH